MDPVVGTHDIPVWFGVPVLATFLATLLSLYFLPTIIAFYLRRGDLGFSFLVFAFNLALGWTVLGWFLLGGVVLKYGPKSKVRAMSATSPGDAGP